MFKNEDILRIQPELMKVCFKLTKNKEDAEDLVQDTILKMLDNKDKFEENTNLSAWAFVISRNLFFSKCRKNKRIVELPDNYDAMLSCGPSQDLVVQLKQTCDLMDLLVKDRRQVIIFRALGLTIEEMAEEIGCCEGTIKSLINRATRDITILAA